jgi:hypothetical protein
MATLSAALGIALYFLAVAIGVAPIMRGAAIVLALGVVSIVLGWTIGAARPRLTAAMLTLGAVFALTVGACAAAAGIWITAIIGGLKGKDPSPGMEAVGAAIIAVVGVLVDGARGLDRLKPAGIAAAVIKARYDNRFPVRSDTDTAAYIAAYSALRLDPIGDANGQINGWGFDATVRRLTIIRAALP